MSWTVDGANATATASTASEAAGTVTITGVTGTTAAANGVSIKVPNRAGTYALSGNITGDTLAAYTVGSSQVYFATTGSVVVTTYTKSATANASNVVGTFNFTGSSFSSTGTKALTNGKFNVKF